MSKYIPPKFTNLSEMAMIDVSRLTEDEARNILEGIRWPEGVACPHCGGDDVSRILSKAGSKTRDGLYQCNDSVCRQQFTVTVGTVMQGTHITLRQWVQAFYSMCSHKKGVSALQLQRNLGLKTYKSAWHLAHRIRLAMKQDPLASKLKGVVEVDETYIGGKPPKDGKHHKRGRGTKKAAVLVLVERGGRSVSRPIANIKAKTLRAAIKEMVRRDARIMTDELPSYNGLRRDFRGGHGVVNHGLGQYTSGDASTNTAESYFAILKRGVHGTFHHVSKEHLSKYCDEFSFRWTHRKSTDGERTVSAIRGMEGKRLAYKRTTH